MPRAYLALVVASAIVALCSAPGPASGSMELGEAPAPAERPDRPRAGRVRVVGHSLVDDGGPFLGLGASYFTALWRCKHDRPRLVSDLAFLARQGFNC